MKYVVWGAPGAGKTSIAVRAGLPDRFRGDETLAHIVFESRGADVALVVFDVSARLGDFLVAPGNRIDWYDGPTLAGLLAIPEQIAA